MKAILYDNLPAQKSTVLADMVSKGVPIKYAQSFVDTSVEFEWDENDHPRGHGGEWTSGGSGETNWNKHHEEAKRKLEEAKRTLGEARRTLGELRNEALNEVFGDAKTKGVEAEGSKGEIAAAKDIIGAKVGAKNPGIGNDFKDVKGDFGKVLAGVKSVDKETAPKSAVLNKLGAVGRGLSGMAAWAGEKAARGLKILTDINTHLHALGGTARAIGGAADRALAGTQGMRIDRGELVTHGQPRSGAAGVALETVSRFMHTAAAVLPKASGEADKNFQKIAAEHGRTTAHLVMAASSIAAVGLGVVAFAAAGAFMGMAAPAAVAAGAAVALAGRYFPGFSSMIRGLATAAITKAASSVFGARSTTQKNQDEAQAVEHYAKLKDKAEEFFKSGGNQKLPQASEDITKTKKPTTPPDLPPEKFNPFKNGAGMGGHAAGAFSADDGDDEKATLSSDAIKKLGKAMYLHSLGTIMQEMLGTPEKCKEFTDSIKAAAKDGKLKTASKDDEDDKASMSWMAPSTPVYLDGVVTTALAAQSKLVAAGMNPDTVCFLQEA